MDTNINNDILIPSQKEDFDVPLRPQKLQDFIGQKNFTRNLEVYIKAAKMRKEPLSHLLLSGPPGLGKTTLANIVSKEMNVNFKATSAPILEKTGDMAAILTDISEGDVFFIDEIHRLKKNIEELLYSAMEDFSIDLIIGQGPSAKTIKISIEPFTLIGATTRSGLISSPLFARFGIHGQLDFYSTDEMQKIIIRSANILKIKIDKKAASIIAKSSRFTPRIANRILMRIRDFAQVEGLDIINEKIVNSSLKRMEIDEIGLNKMDIKILTVLIDHYGGGPVGCKAIAVAIGEEPETVEEVYEPFLIQLGFIQRTPRGRVATLKAYQHLGLDYKGKINNEKYLF